MMKNAEGDVTRRVTIATMASTDNVILAIGLMVKSACSLVAKESCRSWEEISYICIERVSGYDQDMSKPVILFKDFGNHQCVVVKSMK
jgi:hypothetical protein